jgi:tRNA (guanine-N7-)-methyltransferase
MALRMGNQSSGGVPEAIKQADRERRERLRDWVEQCLPARFDLEIGAGHGHWLVSYAMTYPERFGVGIDVISQRVRRANLKVEKRGLENVLFRKAEALEFLGALKETGRQLDRVFLFFPDPWPKKRHHRRRFVQRESLDQLAEVSRKDAPLFFRTDHREYFQWTLEHLQDHPRWRLDPGVPWPHEEPSFFEQLLPEFQSLTARCSL